MDVLLLCEGGAGEAKVARVAATELSGLGAVVGDVATCVSSSDPVGSFQALLARRDPDRLFPALGQEMWTMVTPPRA